MLCTNAKKIHRVIFIWFDISLIKKEKKLHFCILWESKINIFLIFSLPYRAISIIWELIDFQKHIVLSFGNIAQILSLYSMLYLPINNWWIFVKQLIKYCQFIFRLTFFELNSSFFLILQFTAKKKNTSQKIDPILIVYSDPYMVGLVIPVAKINAVI